MGVACRILAERPTDPCGDATGLASEQLQVGMRSARIAILQVLSWGCRSSLPSSSMGRSMARVSLTMSLTRLHQLRGLSRAKPLKSLGRHIKSRHYMGERSRDFLDVSSHDFRRRLSRQFELQLSKQER